MGTLWGDTIHIEVHQISGAPKSLLGTPKPNVTTLSINKL